MELKERNEIMKILVYVLCDGKYIICYISNTENNSLFIHNSF